MGENASTTESSKSSESGSKSSDAKTRSKSKSESKTTVQRTADVPAAKGHGSTGPDALGIDRMADQERKNEERSLGPASVRRMEESGQIDREPSDFQREAKDLASRISSDPEGTQVDRSADDAGTDSGGDSGGEPTTVQRSAEGEAASSGGDEGGGGPSSLVENVVSSSGGRLDPGVRSEMGAKMGTDFSDVRVHTGPEAGKAANAINAKAFTVGNHIGFNHGAFDTSSAEGKHTIAHELAHVQQQASDTRRMAQRVTEGSGLEVSDPKDPHERQAETVARRVMQGEDVRVDRLQTTPKVSRTGGGSGSMGGAIASGARRIGGAISGGAQSLVEGGKERMNEAKERAKEQKQSAVSQVEDDAGLEEKVTKLEEDVDVLYENVMGGPLADMMEGGAGEGAKMATTFAGQEAGKRAGSMVPGMTEDDGKKIGKKAGSIAGAGVQKLLENREKIAEMLGWWDANTTKSGVSGQQDTGSQSDPTGAR